MSTELVDRIQNDMAVPYDGGTSSVFVQSNDLAQFSEAGIDKQIATAHRFPRSVAGAVQEAADLAVANKTIAAACTYALPRDGKTIKGPSVRLAEIFQYAWGNIRTASMIVGDDGKFIKVASMGLDLQKNSGFQNDIIRPITKKNGARFSDDMVSVTANAAASIARRNVIFLLIPRAYVNKVHAEAMKVAAGSLMTLEEDRYVWLKHYMDQGVPEVRIYAALEVKGLEDITTDHLVTLQGFNTSINEGATTLEDIFPAPKAKIVTPGAGPRTKSEALTEKLGGKVSANDAKLASKLFGDDGPPGRQTGEEG